MTSTASAIPGNILASRLFTTSFIIVRRARQVCPQTVWPRRAAARLKLAGHAGGGLVVTADVESEILTSLEPLRFTCKILTYPRMRWRLQGKEKFAAKTLHN